MNARANNMSRGILIIAIFCFLSAGYAFAVNPADNAGEKTEGAQQKPGKPETIVLPSIEYKSDGLRDPFEGVFKKEGLSAESIGQLTQAPPQVQLPSLTVQGIIWGAKIPQAIINDKLVKVGDTVSEAKITAIGKDGIEVIFKNYTFKITSPAAAQLQNLKTKPEGGKNEK